MKKKFKITITLLLSFVLLFCFSAQSFALSKYGSRGNEVREIQKRLKKWDYYNGSVDGIYGTKTKKAVIKFQKRNGLTADGIAGKKTLEKMGIHGLSNNSSKNSDVNLLARVISAEARGENYRGQVAVGAVILNRVAHSSFPDTVSGVVYQSGAFDCMYDGQINKKVVDSAYKAAQDALNGWDPSGGAIYYYNPKTAKSSWIKKRPIITTIGNHVFCK